MNKSRQLITLISLLCTIIITLTIGCADETVKSNGGTNHGSYFTNSAQTRLIKTESPIFQKVVEHSDISNNVVGYTVDMTVTSRSGPFSIRVCIDDKSEIVSAEVTSYTARRGRAVKSSEFTKQFIGKSSKDRLKVGQDIDSISGATLSAKAMTAGVKKALELIYSHSCLR